MPHIKTGLSCTIQPLTCIIKDVISIFRSSAMEENGITFADYIVNRVCPDNRFLEEMNRVIPWWEIEDWFSEHVKRNHNRPGRPAYPIMLMFKIHLLQQWYNLSDRQAEFQINDRLSFRKFLGLTIEDLVPDATTIENFRHQILEQQNIGKGLIKVLDKYFREIGLIKKEGNLVDATFLQANSRCHKDFNQNSDKDARVGYKGFGYSGTINMDKKSKLIRKVYVTPANILDFKSLDPVLLGDEKEIYADRGYAPCRKSLSERFPNTKLGIMFKRHRGKQGEPAPELSDKEKELNVNCAKIRARVEHAFGVMKSKFGFSRIMYRNLERACVKFESLAIAYNFYRLGFLIRTRDNCA